MILERTSFRFHSIVRKLAPSFDALGIDPTGMTQRDLFNRCMTTDSGGFRRILGTSTKIEKGEKMGILTVVLYLAAADRSGMNTCPMASDGCKAACLGHTTGRLAMSQAQRAQLYKTVALYVAPELFIEQLNAEIVLHKCRARAMGKRCAVRLNGSSDILWEKYGVPQQHPDVEFYDYTKWSRKARSRRPANYSLTFSLDERPESMGRATEWLDHGGNAAVVVASDQMPKGSSIKTPQARKVAARMVRSGYAGYPAISGDESDARMDDTPGSWVVLYAKGRDALSDVSGFVRRFAL